MNMTSARMTIWHDSTSALSCYCYVQGQFQCLIYLTCFKYSMQNSGISKRSLITHFATFDDSF